MVDPEEKITREGGLREIKMVEMVDSGTKKRLKIQRFTVDVLSTPPPVDDFFWSWCRATNKPSERAESAAFLKCSEGKARTSTAL